MNIFTAIGGFFKRVFGSEQNWEKAASITLTVAQPLVQTLLTLTTGPEVAAEESKVVQIIQADLKTVNDIVVSSGPTPDALTLLDAILANLRELTSSVAIKDPTSQAAFNAITVTLIGEMEAIIQLIPGSTANTAAKA